MTTEDPRQCWRTPAWVLDALLDGGWAGPWDVDAFADADGGNAVTERNGGVWSTGQRTSYGWHHATNPIDWNSKGGLHVFANPPFRLWARCVSDALAAMASPTGPASVTLVGLYDPSTVAVQRLTEAGAARTEGAVHATLVPIAGRWGFDPPPGITASGTDRAHGVWVLRRVISRPRKETDR